MLLSSLSVTVAVSVATAVLVIPYLVDCCHCCLHCLTPAIWQWRQNKTSDGDGNNVMGDKEGNGKG
jgi:hypothetical protein